MRKIVKKGLFITFVYIMAIVSTLLVTDRVSELDSNNLNNDNTSLTIKLSK